MKKLSLGDAFSLVVKTLLSAMAVICFTLLLYTSVKKGDCQRRCSNEGLVFLRAHIGVCDCVSEDNVINVGYE
ncbi:MAG: hypothetical protein DRH30_10445 [Deltaproteobacteria bacterium]|nr:MAG: hypothetical protein DRH30_10445 [Deltaproteobacteria bacterium]